jgi:dihydroneopterin aldolase
MTLENTINYEELFQVIKLNFEKTKPLLEEVVHMIVSEVEAKFPFLSYLFISIQKKNPPLGQDIESSEVSFEKNFDKN